jgi:hypothetical protein
VDAGQPDDEGELIGLSALEQPAEVIGAAGQWLASQLRGEGFTWARSLAKLERRIGVRREQIHLQSSKWNRTGELIEFGAVLNVRDGALRKWRRANPALTSYAGVNDDWLCGHPLGVLTGVWHQGQVDLTAPAARSAQLDGFLRLLRAEALPWFGGSAEPEQAADKLPSVTIGMYVVDLAEWLVCRGSQDAAARLMRRWLAEDSARWPDFESGRSLGEHGERPNISAGQWVRAGWSSAVLGLT